MVNDAATLYVASERRVLAPPLSDKPDLLSVYHRAGTGGIFRTQASPTWPSARLPANSSRQTWNILISGISLTNSRYYIQTVKYKSRETLFWGG